MMEEQRVPSTAAIWFSFDVFCTSAWSENRAWTRLNQTTAQTRSLALRAGLKPQLVPDWCESTEEVSHCKAAGQM